MEAATKGKRKTGEPRRSAATDRELAVRLGALMRHALGSDGGAVMRAVDETGLSFIQFKALTTLARDEQDEHSSVKLVAERLGVSVPSASRAVDELVKRGLASRVEDPEDRRVRRVSLTASGRALGDQVMAARVAGLERFVATLSATERRKLDAALEVLLNREEIGELHRSHRRRLGR
ncbi:MAG: MarR family winged helix-turn-helix transcriptional regulator [Solirubrobacterales bacterium]